MAAVERVLVVGAGAAGCAAAILLARGGVEVDLVEIKPEVGALGSGITLQGNALRIFRELGVWPAVQANGFAFDTLGFRSPAGDLLFEIPDARTGGPDLPATVGMYRPTLARILVDAAIAAGATVHLDRGIAGITQQRDSVAATFSDGTAAEYDLVVGADGVRSATRALLGIELETHPTGMGIWRVIAPRPANVARTDLVHGGPCYIAGYCPIDEDTLYAYLVEDAGARPAHAEMAPSEQLDVVRSLAADYHGPWDEIRASLQDGAPVNYTWFEDHYLEPPWHRGRVVLIGDAVHVCPPTLAQGAAQALEDASVLAGELLARDRLDDELWAAFGTRRHERARVVVEASVQLAVWLLEHDANGDVAGLMARMAGLLSVPS